MKYSIKIFYKIEIFYQNWKFLVTKSIESRFLRQPKLMRNLLVSRGSELLLSKLRQCTMVRSRARKSYSSSIAKPYSFFKRLIENVLFLRPHRPFGRLRDELWRQYGLRTGGVQRVPQSCRRCRGGVKKRITFIRRRRRTSQTAVRESHRSLCIARSQDVRHYPTISLRCFVSAG